MTLPNWALAAKERRQRATPGNWKALSSDVEDAIGHTVAKAFSTPALDGRSLFERANDNAEFIAQSKSDLARYETALEIAVKALQECVDDRHYGGCFPRHTEALAAIQKLGEK